MATGWVFDIVPAGDGVTVWFRAKRGRRRRCGPLSAPPSSSRAGGSAGKRPRRPPAAGDAPLPPARGPTSSRGRRCPRGRSPSPASTRCGKRCGRPRGRSGPRRCTTPTSPPSSSSRTPRGCIPWRAPRSTSRRTASSSTPASSTPPGTPTRRSPRSRRRASRPRGRATPPTGGRAPSSSPRTGRTHVLPWEGGVDLLRELQRLLDAHDPDLLVTEYGDDFILPRLLALAARLRFPLRLGRKGPRGGNRRGRRPPHPGALVLLLRPGRLPRRGALPRRPVARGRPQLVPLRRHRPPRAGRAVPPLRASPSSGWRGRRRGPPSPRCRRRRPCAGGSSCRSGSGSRKGSRRRRSSWRPTRGGSPTSPAPGSTRTPASSTSRRCTRP